MNKTETARRPRKYQKWSVDVRESSGVGAASTEKTIIRKRYNKNCKGTQKVSEIISRMLESSHRKHKKCQKSQVNLCKMAGVCI